MDKSLMQKIIDCANDEYDFYGKSEKFLELQKAVFKTGDKALITYFMQNVYGAAQKPLFDGVDFEALEDAIMSAKAKTDEKYFIHETEGKVCTNDNSKNKGFEINIEGVDFSGLQNYANANAQKGLVYCVCLDGEMGDLSRVCNMKRHGKQIDELIASLLDAEEELDK